jgi:hypothetical protein
MLLRFSKIAKYTALFFVVRNVIKEGSAWMSGVKNDYIGCSVILYDEEGATLSSATVVSHNIIEKRIQLDEISDVLRVGDMCRLLILTEPSPREYFGRIRFDFGDSYIALFRGKEKELRGATRYKVNFAANIEKLIYNGKEYDLYEPVEVRLINISTSGMRFCARLNTINIDDRFKATISFDDNVKTLYAQVVNKREIEDSREEYGCRFLMSADSLF